MIISNKTEKTIFFDKKKLKIVNELDFSISNHLSNSGLTSHQQNSNYYIYRPDEYNNILEDIVPIPPKTSWKYKKNFALIEKSNLFLKNYCANHAIYLF